MSLRHSKPGSQSDVAYTPENIAALQCQLRAENQQIIALMRKGVRANDELHSLLERVFDKFEQVIDVLTVSAGAITQAADDVRMCGEALRATVVERNRIAKEDLDERRGERSAHGRGSALLESDSIA